MLKLAENLVACPRFLKIIVESRPDIEAFVSRFLRDRCNPFNGALKKANHSLITSFRKGDSSSPIHNALVKRLSTNLLSSRTVTSALCQLLLTLQLLINVPSSSLLGGWSLNIPPCCSSNPPSTSATFTTVF